MNKNIKLAIYFLLGIVLFYLMFNGNGVEGFDAENVGFIYVKVDTAGSSGTFERFDKLEDGSSDIPEETASDATATGLQGPLDEILTGGTNTYYKSASGNLFIQTVVAASCSGGEDCSELSGLSSCEAGFAVEAESCAWSQGTCSGGEGDVCSGLLDERNCVGTDAVPAVHCEFNPERTEYYLVMKSDATPPVISSIHKITSSSGLDSLSGDTTTPVVIPETSGEDSQLKVYTLSEDGSPGSYENAPDTTTVTIDTFPRCSTPEDITGYTPVETSLKLGDDFNVSGTCASGYTGPFAAVACEADNTPYRLTGCTTETHDFTCNNGSAASGSSTTPTESCTACDDGYSLDSDRCVPNGSCSDFTATCPEGKEVNEDKSCSGTCTTDECCEEESNLVMICLVVCLLIFCVILIGAGAYLTIGKKSSGPPIKSGPPGY